MICAFVRSEMQRSTEVAHASVTRVSVTFVAIDADNRNRLSCECSNWQASSDNRGWLREVE
jgi:hypothetical protein